MASNMAQGPPEVVAHLEKAKSLYLAKKLPQAIVTFIQAANACDCGVKYDKHGCECKSLVQAALKGFFKQELKKKCTCGYKSDVRCKNSMHVAALDGVAACREASGRIDMAIVVAECMIHLSPRDPKGYLRLGKLLRLDKNHPLEAAFKVNQVGIALVSEKDPHNRFLHKMLKLSEILKGYAGAQDPLTKMPLEVALIIFEKVDFRSLCRCLSVSKSWHKLLTTKDKSIASIWRRQDYTGCVLPAQSAFNQYLTYADFHVKEFTYRNRRDAVHGIRYDILDYLVKQRAYRDLECLKLMNLPITYVPQERPRKWNKLKTFHFGSSGQASGVCFVKKLLSGMDSLEHLVLWNLPVKSRWLNMESLVYLSICTRHSTVEVHLNHLLNGAPNLERVRFDRVNLRMTGPSHPAWTKLKSFILGPNATFNVAGPHRMYIYYKSLEELLVLGNGDYRFLIQPIGPHEESKLETKQLRTLALRNATNVFPPFHPHLEYLRPWLQPGLESGKLKSLEVNLPKEFPDWFRGEGVTFMSLRNLAMRPVMDVYQLDEEIFQVLERFPKLQGIDIGDVPFSNATIANAIKKTEVRTVYYGGSYFARDELRKWALNDPSVKIFFKDYTETYLPDWNE